MKKPPAKKGAKSKSPRKPPAVRKSAEVQIHGHSDTTPAESLFPPLLHQEPSHVGGRPGVSLPPVGPAPNYDLLDRLGYEIEHWLSQARRNALGHHKNDYDPQKAAQMIYWAAREFCHVLREVYEQRPDLLTGLGARHESAPWLLKITEGPEQIEVWLEHLDLAASVAAKFRGEGIPKNLVSAAVAREIREALLSVRETSEVELFTSSFTDKSTGKRTRAIVQIDPSNGFARERNQRFKAAIDRQDWEAAAKAALPFQARRGPANGEWRQLVTCVLQNRYGADYHQSPLFKDIISRQNLDKEGRTQGRQAVFNSIWTSFQGLMQDPDQRFSQFKTLRARPGKVKSVK